MSKPLQALDLVDARTRRDLEGAVDTDEIHKILDRPTTRWMTHARCLRHPFKEHGCKLPMDSDLEPLSQQILLYQARSQYSMLRVVDVRFMIRIAHCDWYV